MCFGSQSSSSTPAPQTPGLPGELKVAPDYSQADKFKGKTPAPNVTGRTGGSLLVPSPPVSPSPPELLQ